MLSSSSCSRSGTSSRRPLKSSSGAIPSRISRITALTSAVVIPGALPLFSHSLDDNDRVDAQHPERIVQDHVAPLLLARGVGDQALERALGIEPVYVDRGVTH